MASPFPPPSATCAQSPPPPAYPNPLTSPSQISPKSAIPLNAILISLVICILLSLINIGSTAALNAILALDLTALLASYTISISCLLFKRLRNEPLPHREWSLGRAGTAINVAALCWLLPVLVFTLFPSSVPVTPDGMNWGCLLFGFMVLFASGFYVVRGRGVYVSPRERLRRDLEGEGAVGL
jgi:amino acid transporter